MGREFVRDSKLNIFAKRKNQFAKIRHAKNWRTKLGKFQILGGNVTIKLLFKLIHGQICSYSGNLLAKFNIKQEFFGKVAM